MILNKSRQRQMQSRKLPYFNCTERCSELESPANGQVVVDTSSSQPIQAHYSCDAGFTLVGNTIRTCLTTGAWTGAKPICRGGLVSRGGSSGGSNKVGKNYIFNLAIWQYEQNVVIYVTTLRLGKCPFLILQM